MTLPFGERLARAVRAVGAPVAVGLDPHLERLPAHLRARFETLTGGARRAAAAEAVAEFDALALRAMAGRVAAVKVQFAFYEQLGAPGFAALESTCRAAREAGLLLIGDGKRGDIDSTARAYATAMLDPDGPFGCDAFTVNPWMGFDTLEPWLERCRAHGAGLFVLARTTNPGSADLQRQGEPPAALRVAAAIHRLGAELRGETGLSSVGAVVGAQTPADEVAALRAAMPDAWFLVPGVGAQGGDLDAVLRAGLTADGGLLINSSRGILYAGEAGEALPAARREARRLQQVMARALSGV